MKFRLRLPACREVTHHIGVGTLFGSPRLVIFAFQPCREPRMNVYEQTDGTEMDTYN